MKKQSIQERARWGALRRFNPKMMGVMPDRWWTDIRKMVLDVVVRSSDATGECSISLHEIANRAFTTKGNASKIIKALEEFEVLEVKRQRIQGKYKSEQNEYRFVPTVWALVSSKRSDKHTDIWPCNTDSVVSGQQELDIFAPIQPAHMGNNTKLTHQETVQATANIRKDVSEVTQISSMDILSPQDSYEETDNIYNNPHKGIKKTSYNTTTGLKVSCENQGNSTDMVSKKQVGNHKRNPVFIKKMPEVDCKTHPPCGNAIIGVVCSHDTAKNRPNGLCGWHPSSMSPPDRSKRAETSRKGFSKEKPFWQNSPPHIRNKLLFALQQFDEDKANRFANTHTAGEVLGLLQEIREQFVPTIRADKFESVFWKINGGRYLAMRAVIHLVVTMCKVHFVADGVEGTIRTTPERFFFGTIDRWHPPTVNQLLDSLDRMTAENERRYAMTVAERYALYQREKQQLELEQAKAKENRIPEVLIDKAIDRRKFYNIIRGRMYSEYGRGVYYNILDHIKVNKTNVTAPRGMIEFIRKHYMPRICALLEQEGIEVKDAIIF